MKTEYDILQDYMENICEQCYVRVFSDSTCTVSGYIGNERISIEGSYNMVVMCLKNLYKELKGTQSGKRAIDDPDIFNF